MKPTVDVVIPVFQPQEEFRELLCALDRQTIPVGKVVVMETQGSIPLKVLPVFHFRLEIYSLEKSQFDHAGTRNEGISHCTAEYVLLLTQDVRIEEDDFLEKLCAPMNEQVIVSYARQLPKENAGPIERAARSFNYPAEARLKSERDIGKMGIKAFFVSDVACLYNREKFVALGGFSAPAIFNEDMVFAAGVLKNHYQISYTPSAFVRHSHNLSLKASFQRQFDLGVSQQNHPEVFAVVSSEKEGVSMVKMVTGELCQNGHFYWIPYFYFQCFVKLIGYKMGKKYLSFSKKFCEKCSSNKVYWRKNS